MSAENEIWILGANGRIGRGVGIGLAARGLSTVLVGRDRARLEETAAAIDGPTRIVVAGSVDAIGEALGRGAPSVVVNTIGPFTRTALEVARACPDGAGYVDVANDMTSVIGVLESHEEAVERGQCRVTGAGFGFVATESVVRALCEGRPAPERVRVDAMPFIADDGSPVGATVAATVVDALPEGGRRYEAGRLVRAALGSDGEELDAARRNEGDDGQRAVRGPRSGEARERCGVRHRRLGRGADLAGGPGAGLRRRADPLMAVGPRRRGAEAGAGEGPGLGVATGHVVDAREDRVDRRHGARGLAPRRRGNGVHRRGRHRSHGPAREGRGASRRAHSVRALRRAARAGRRRPLRLRSRHVSGAGRVDHTPPAGSDGPAASVVLGVQGSGHAKPTP